MSDDTPARDWPAWASEPITIEPADPAWSRRGEVLCAGLAELLAPWLVAGVHHVGSTSVPGLAAKPILDCMAGVASLEPVDAIATALAPHGWHHVSLELDRRPWRRFFVLVEGDRRAAHLHVVRPDAERFRDQLTFRDRLRASPELARQYAALKRRLAGEHAGDREAYSEGKADFVRRVVGAAP